MDSQQQLQELLHPYAKLDRDSLKREIQLTEGLIKRYQNYTDPSGLKGTKEREIYKLQLKINALRLALRDLDLKETVRYE